MRFCPCPRNVFRRPRSLLKDADGDAADEVTRAFSITTKWIVVLHMYGRGQTTVSAMGGATAR